MSLSNAMSDAFTYDTQQRYSAAPEDILLSRLAQASQELERLVTSAASQSTPNTIPSLAEWHALREREARTRNCPLDRAGLVVARNSLNTIAEALAGADPVARTRQWEVSAVMSEEFFMRHRAAMAEFLVNGSGNPMTEATAVSLIVGTYAPSLIFAIKNFLDVSRHTPALSVVHGKTPEQSGPRTRHVEDANTAESTDEGACDKNSIADRPFERS